MELVTIELFTDDVVILHISHIRCAKVKKQKQNTGDSFSKTFPVITIMTQSLHVSFARAGTGTSNLNRCGV